MYNTYREKETLTILPRHHRRRRFINLSLCGKHTHHTTVLYLCRIRRRGLACRSSAHHHSIIAVIWRIRARYSLGNDVFQALNNDETSRMECEMTGVKGFRIIYTHTHTCLPGYLRYDINGNMRSKFKLHTRQ